MRALLRLIQRILLFVVRRLQHLERSVFGEKIDFAQQQAVVRSTTHDMAEEPDEAYYRDEYLYWIGRTLSDRKILPGSQWLDLGCGQGRLTIPLALQYPESQFAGVDLSAAAVTKAQAYAARQNVANCHFQEGDIESWLRSRREDAQVVLMNEVTFFYPQWRKALPLIEARTKPGAIFFLSFRPLYYYALLLARDGLLEIAASDLLKQREGPLFPGFPASFTWCQHDEIKAELTNNFNFRLINSIGIGTCSGIAGDPHAGIVRPSSLSPREINALRTVERFLGERVPDAGRYMLLILERT